MKFNGKYLLNSLSSYYLLFFLFIVAFFFNYISNVQFPIMDDIVHLFEIKEYQHKSWKEIVNYQMNLPSRVGRPLSGLYIGSIIYFARFGDKMFYIPNVIFFIISLLLYKKVLEKNLKNKFLIFTLVFATSIFPYSSSTLFSVIMGMVSFQMCFYLISLLLFYKRKYFTYFIGGLINLLLSFIVEYFIFLVPFNLLLIFHLENYKINKKTIISLFLGIGIHILLFFGYKLFGQQMIFQATSDYSTGRISFSFEKMLIIPLSLLKMLTLDTVFIVWGSFRNIIFYNFLDFFCLILGLFLVFKIAFAKEITNIFLNKRFFLISSLLVFCSIFMFFISNYPLTVFSTQNRTLGLFRFTYILFMFSAILVFIKIEKIKKILLSFILSIFLVCFISLKNSWIYAGKYNLETTKKIIKLIPKSQLSQNFLITYNAQNNTHLIADEDVIAYHAFIKYAVINFNEEFKNLNFEYLRMYDYSLYSIAGKDFNTRNINYQVNNDGITIRGKLYHFPIYIINTDYQKINFIKTEKEFKNYIKLK